MCASASDTRSESNGLTRYSVHPERMAAMMVSGEESLQAATRLTRAIAVVAQMLGDPAGLFHAVVKIDHADADTESPPAYA